MPDKDTNTKPYTALKLEAELPRSAIREYSRYIHNAIDENLDLHGGFEAICRLSKEVTGDGLSFPVVAGDSGVYAIPTMQMRLYGLDKYLLLGFCGISSDGKRVVRPIPLPGWTGQSEYMKDMMKHAVVTR